MTMHRRHFLAALASGAVMTAEGLWVPGKKLISIPKVGRLDSHSGDIPFGDPDSSLVMGATDHPYCATINVEGETLIEVYERFMQEFFEEGSHEA